MQKTQKKRLLVAVIGKGRLGTSLALALKKTKSFILHSHLPARAASFKTLHAKGGPDILLIVTRDARVSAVAKNAVRQCGENLLLIAHCAGSMPPDILPKRIGIMRATFHPMQTFAKPDGNLFAGITWGISTDSDTAATTLRKLATEIGSTKTLRLDPKILPLYHSLIVYGANFIKLLGTAIEAITKEIGIPEKTIKTSLRPILTRALEDTLTQNSRDVLTGPIARGDKATIERHRKALKALPPEILAVYDDFLKLAKRFGLWNMK